MGLIDQNCVVFRCKCFDTLKRSFTRTLKCLVRPLAVLGGSEIQILHAMVTTKLKVYTGAVSSTRSTHAFKMRILSQSGSSFACSSTKVVMRLSNCFFSDLVLNVTAINQSR